MNFIQDYMAPTSLDEAARLLASGDATVLAGGTDLMPQTRSGARQFKRALLNISRLEELHGIGRADGKLRIAALTTVTEVLQSDLLQSRAPILVQAADRFAAGQVRNSATIGGNICNASPAGDMIIPLLLLDAVVDLASWSADGLTLRTVPLRDFFVGPGNTVMAGNEIFTGVRFNAPGAGFVARFEKAGARPALDISVVSVGVAGRLENRALVDARVAFGAVAPVPRRGPRTEAFIEGRVLDEQAIAEAAETARGEVSPITDVRASAWYRKELVAVFTRRLLSDVSQP